MSDGPRTAGWSPDTSDDIPWIGNDRPIPTYPEDPPQEEKPPQAEIPSALHVPGNCPICGNWS